MNTIIVSNGVIEDYDYYKKYINSGQFAIYCDGAVRHAKCLNLKPNLIIGDFDSAIINDINFYEQKNIEFKRFKTQKDETDTELAVKEAMNLNSNSITLIGGLGGRFDHALANVHLLLIALKNGIEMKLVNECGEISMFDKEINLSQTHFKYLSLIPFTEKAIGVTTEGLLYPLNDETLEIGTTRGVSNELTGDYAKVTIKKGILIAILSNDIN